MNCACDYVDGRVVSLCGAHCEAMRPANTKIDQLNAELKSLSRQLDESRLRESIALDWIKKHQSRPENADRPSASSKP